HDLYGYDLASTDHTARRRRLAACFGPAYDDHVRLAKDERTIPFDDRRFDVVYANQVFEHVRFFDRIVQECARVLKPDGVLLANFPLATYPVEWHLKIPFAHWLPPGELRVRYLQLFYALGLRPTLPGSSALETARSQDAYLRDRTYYRFVNEVLAVAAHHFESCEIETGQFIQAKLDLLATSDRQAARWAGSALRLLHGQVLDNLVTYLFNAAFCLRRPRAKR
ncbi:MAG: class I SAM-dependent methyltransferase, partial [Chloroflexota bacterium]